MRYLAEIILILSVIILTCGVYLKFGLEYAAIEAGVYLGLIAFAMAAKRE